MELFAKKFEFRPRSGDGGGIAGRGGGGQVRLLVRLHGVNEFGEGSPKWVAMSIVKQGEGELEVSTRRQGRLKLFDLVVLVERETVEVEFVVDLNLSVDEGTEVVFATKWDQKLIMKFFEDFVGNGSIFGTEACKDLVESDVHQ